MEEGDVKLLCMRFDRVLEGCSAVEVRLAQVEERRKGQQERQQQGQERGKEEPEEGEGGQEEEEEEEEEEREVENGSRHAPFDPKVFTEESFLYECKRIRLKSAVLKRVPSNYYDEPLSWRQNALGAHSIDHLCKSIILENTHCIHSDCHDRLNSRYYCVILQYVSKLSSEKIARFVRKTLSKGKVSKSAFNFRLAPPEDALQLTGYINNAVTPVGMLHPIPLILSHSIMDLLPSYFWLGGGEVDLKLRVQIDEFIKVFDPFITDVTMSDGKDASTLCKEFA
eukprot:TRINITY_DN234_c0_g4_i1.p1 TRINITY_DN234_c0_g4~~TRINITY_DN234_c0_g4_i1.p1  ORF type:complete len:282 (+),score=96.56 TRINITY_DN234_c0_g4_i1:81-926(+)